MKFPRSTVLLVASIAASAGAQTPCDVWQFTATPTRPDSSRDGAFNAAANAADDVWAVGSSYTTRPLGGMGYETLALHFDGSSWKRIVTPSPAPKWNNELFDAVALGPSKVYAVGAYNPVSLRDVQTLVLGWDGAAWTHIDSPRFAGGSSFWGAADARNGKAWMVGGHDDGTGGGSMPMAFLFDGATFSEKPVETPGFRGQFYSVSVLSPDLAFAAGYWGDGSGFHALVERWDGASWKAEPVSVPGVPVEFYDIAALSATDVWAVGYRFDDALGIDQPVIVHYDGAAWTTVALPDFPGSGADLETVIARSATEVYAAGTNQASGSPSGLVLKYDGASWTPMDIAPTGGTAEWFRGGTLVPGSSEVWAVGEYFSFDAGKGAVLGERLPSCGTPCRPDCNEDGKLNVNDFICFKSKWDARTTYGDFDGDGKWNIKDFIAFQLAFNQGCK